MAKTGKKARVRAVKLENMIRIYYNYKSIKWNKFEFITGIICILRRENINLCFQ